MINQAFKPSPRISICIPTYNGCEHLKECLDSILAQTFNDFEVIICDDQSSDGTLQLARNLTKGDERFRFVQNPRRLGLVGNWNHCITISKGEWIKFVFQDDFLLPDCLERMVTVAQQTGSNFLVCRRDFQFEEKTTSEIRAFYAKNAAAVESFFSQNTTCQPDAVAHKILECVTANFIGEPTVTFIHRKIFDQCGLFNENLIMCCDSEYWYRAGTHGPVTFIPETLAIFRVHNNSTSASNFGLRRFRMDLLDPLIVIQEFIHHPSYDFLRRIAQQKFDPDYLQKIVRERAWRVWQALRLKDTMQTEDNLFCLQEWESVCKAYPSLKKLACPSLLRRLIWKFKKLLPLKPAIKKCLGNSLLKSRT